MEREDNSFHHVCMFCSEEFTGNRLSTGLISAIVVSHVNEAFHACRCRVFRATLLNHMAREHSFSIGLPDNIVYCKQFLEMLQSKLDRSEHPSCTRRWICL